MQHITFHCETVTPMFLSGADGMTPELRPPSIKGALRFWWRAMNGHLGLEDMRMYEGMIFGDTQRRSSFGIRMSYPEFDAVLEKPVPRNEKSFKKPAIPIGVEFDILLTPFKQKIEVTKNGKLIEIFNPDKLKDLMTTTLLLGGVGFRSRRGFGATYFRESQVSVLNDFMSLKEYIDKIPTLSSSSINYPYIKKINIGKRYNQETDLLEMIALSAHHNDHPSTGFVSQDKNDARFASPIIVGVVKVQNNEFYPIITTLNTAPKNQISDLRRQDLFKNEIL